MPLQTGLWTVFNFSDAYREAGAVVSETTQEKLGERLGEKLGETRATIIRAMLANPRVTTVQLARSLRMSSTAIEKNLKFLKENGYIQRIGPARGGHWDVIQ